MKRAIIFGAGIIGIKVREIFEMEGINVICFFDNNETKWGTKCNGLLVYSPKDLDNIEYDFIGIGALKGAETIRKQLIEKGISQSIIRIPITNKRIFYNEQDNLAKKYYFKDKMAFQLSNRVDILLRYLLLKIHLFEGEINNELLGLIDKCFKNDYNITDTLEGIVRNIIYSKFPLRNKEENVLNKIKQIAEDDKYWYQLYSDKELINVCFKEAIELLNCNESKIELFNAYIELNKHCGLIVLIGEDNEEILPTLMLPEVKINLEDNFIGFINLIQGYYNNQESYIGNITNSKILELKNLEIRILLVENFQIVDSKKLKECNNIFIIKERLREFKNNVLNNQTLKFLYRRLPLCEEKRFFEMLDEVKYNMKKYNIPLDKVCIVGGGTLQAYGMRKATDIDLIITDDLRKLYGNGLVIVSDNVEIHHSNEFDISDHDIIMNPQNHFYYYGIKFISLDILYRKRKLTRSTDARLIELFKKYKTKY